jgi:nucleoside-diphosphate-sugar epimerase
MTRVLVTGAGGFVGRALLATLARRHPTVAMARRLLGDLPAGVEPRLVGEIGPDTEWDEALAGINTVVHLAARVHRRGRDTDEAGFRRVNAEGTRRLAETARRRGVRRLIFLSSVKVNGEATAPGRPFRESDAPAPQDAYARSKWAAEEALAEIAGDGLEVLILRPPLVYGPGVKANMLALLRLCASGVPLPFGGIENRRSLLGLDNLVDAIRAAVGAPAAPGLRTYLLRDGSDLSTADLIRHLCAGLGRTPRLLPLPPALLRLGLGAIGRGEAAERLLGSLTVDDSRFRADFAWQPPVSAADGLAATALWFRRDGAAPRAAA